MKERGTGIFENGLIWFGAAVSIAEIVTGSYLAPLGLGRGLAAIIIGHVIGCILLFLAGLIGGVERKSAMETVKMSFGSRGALLFCLLNIVQLVGWTGIMIYDGALAAGALFDMGHWLWCLVIGALISLWIIIGIKNLGKVNTVAMAALFILSLVLSFVVFKKELHSEAVSEAMSFGAAVELSVAMPLSWLPLISDYTREAERPVRATAVSALCYGLVSSWMYAIGLGAALATGESDIARIMLAAGLGVAGLATVLLSTVTTTFLDAYSAGVSGESLPFKVNGRKLALATAALGTLGAIFLPLTDITDFLYFIGSVFAPMIAVQIANYFFINKDRSAHNYSITDLIIWALGFALYRFLMGVDIPVGSTLPDMVITVLLCLAVNKLKGKK